MTPVTVINKIQVKPGKMDELLELQQKFAATLPSNVLVGRRMYRSLDGTAAVLVSTFRSQSAQAEMLQHPDFKAHVERLRPLVESSSPMLYEEAYATGDYR